MKMILLVCAFAAAASAAAQAASMISPGLQAPQPVAPSAQSNPAMAAKCKAASYARQPAGQMATTMRTMQIERCIKNNGFID